MIQEEGKVKRRAARSMQQRRLRAHSCISAAGIRAERVSDGGGLKTEAEEFMGNSAV